MSNIGFQFAECHLQLVQLLVLPARVPPDTSQDDNKYGDKEYEDTDTDNDRYHNHYHTGTLLFYKLDVPNCCHLIT